MGHAICHGTDGRFQSEAGCPCATMLCPRLKQPQSHLGQPQNLQLLTLVTALTVASVGDRSGSSSKGLSETALSDSTDPAVLSVVFSSSEGTTPACLHVVNAQSAKLILLSVLLLQLLPVFGSNAITSN